MRACAWLMVPVDLGKLRSNIDYVRRTVLRLREISRTDRADFLHDDVLQAASIRYLQTAWAVHLYDEIDPGEIHEILTSHLDDFERFLSAVTDRYFHGGS